MEPSLNSYIRFSIKTGLKLIGCEVWTGFISPRSSVKWWALVRTVMKLLLT
jgi:hypothetical protein